MKVYVVSDTNKEVMGVYYRLSDAQDVAKTRYGLRTEWKHSNSHGECYYIEVSPHRHVTIDVMKIRGLPEFNPPTPSTDTWDDTWFHPLNDWD